MDWQSVIDTARAVLAGVVGSGIIIYAVANFLSEKIADRLQSKYQLKLDKELEKHKTKLSTKAYISKTRFDREFAMYQELAEKNITMVYDAGEAVLISRGLYNNEWDEVAVFLEKFCSHINNAETTNKKYAPFITKEIFEKYRELESMASRILSYMKMWKAFVEEMYPSEVILSHKDREDERMTHDSVVLDIESTQKELSALSDEIIDSLRNYLATIDVID